MATAIWKDTYWTGVAGNFTINEGSSTGRTVMSGIAQARPGEAYANVNIARLVEDNVIHSAPSFNVGYTVSHDDATKVFFVNGTSSMTFQWDWSYIERDYNSNTVFNFNIKDKWATNQLRFFTSLVNGFLKTTTSEPTPNTCGEYALYYLNRFGGWDSFLFEGKCTRKDAISGQTLTQEYDNTNPLAFGLTNYFTKITPKWELNTGWLSEEQSKTFAFNVVPSPMVYLHNLVENTIFPVVITNTEVEYKQKTRQNRRINYVLNVTKSQDQRINI